ncbi:MAG: LysR family transcriptional regulator substrate-binding protein, partial [Myxococcota bacterium]
GGATATTYLLPPLLGAFHARFPGIQLFVREQGSQSVLEDIARGVLDIGVITLPANPDEDPSAEHSVDVEPWVRDELRLIVPRAHPLYGHTHFAWEDLDGASLVLFEAGSVVRTLLDAKMSAAGISTETVMELRSIESIKQMVAQGIGAAFVSKFALDDDDGGLVARDGVTRDLAIVTRSGRTPSRAASAFLELMKSPHL